jgi:hypothetical protein
LRDRVTERQRNRETEKDREIRRDRQTERQIETDRQTDRPTERQINGFDLLLHFLWSPKRPGFVAQTVKRKTTSLTRLSISKLKSIKSSISTNGTL